MNKLLSIIIPTRNRQIYCIESIKSILPDIDNRCEIVIQDNSAENDLKGLINDLKNSNIIYNYNHKPLSFIDNFEEAINLSSGRYFIILGDDDSTTKDILPIVEWMDKNEIESVSSKFVVDYIWPNEKINVYKTGKLTIPNYTGDFEDIDVDKNLNALIENGFLNYQIFNLPRTYHGIVKRECMDEVKKMGGRYFGGLTPDIYSTVALATVIKRHKIIDFPFSIAGACPASATVNATVGGHSGKLSDAPHFNHRGNYNWEESIPRYYSVETIWAETAIKALKDMKYPNWETKFDKYRLYNFGIFINRKYILSLSIKETLALYKNLKTNIISHIFKMGSNFLEIFYEKKVKRKAVLSHNFFTNKEDIIDLNKSKKVVYEEISKIKKPYEVG